MRKITARRQNNCAPKLLIKTDGVPPTFFAAYEKLLHDSKALDFDDLLLRSARLLRESTATRLKWQARFEYIHVDEYQDTNACNTS